jgi:hypothetical protein
LCIFRIKVRAGKLCFFWPEQKVAGSQVLRGKLGAFPHLDFWLWGKRSLGSLRKNLFQVCLGQVAELDLGRCWQARLKHLDR